MGVVTVWILSVSAFTFPDRRPELYRGSPANVNWLGIPVLTIVSPLSFLVVSFLTYLTLRYPPPAIATFSNWWWVPTFMGAMVVVGLVVYYCARTIRRSQMVEIDLVYKELPPE